MKRLVFNLALPSFFLTLSTAATFAQSNDSLLVQLSRKWANTK